MTTRELRRHDLEGYFGRLRGTLGSRGVEIEVASLGIACDPRADRLEISTDKLSHRILHPGALYVLGGEPGLEAVEIERRNGSKEFVCLKMPALLPSPAS